MTEQDSRIKHLTILHSNDMHGDFLAEKLDDKLVGGVSLLSGYINQTRKESENTLYMIAGDMFRGSLIDSEYQGMTTIELMNALGPDVVSLGNHEVDYGVAHLLFLEKCCKFPIINANLYIKGAGIRLFRSHIVLEVDGMKILVIGIITDATLEKVTFDMLLSSFVSITDAAEEIGTICDQYKGDDIDLTIVLTHIGFDNDLKLAEEIDPACGVDLIIGGHSHTLPDEPAIVNGIKVVQAGIGSNYIGRFELDIDTETNSVKDYTWKTIEINEDLCPKNPVIEELVQVFRIVTETKYSEQLAVLPEKISHPNRYQETEVGNFFCDMLKDQFRSDLVMLGSGGLREPFFGPIITKGNLQDMFPFEEELIEIVLTGKELKEAIRKVLDSTPLDGVGHGEYYQLSRGFCFVLDKKTGELITATRKGKPISDNELLNVALERYHYKNMKTYLGIDPEEINARRNSRKLTGNIRDAIREYLMGHTNFKLGLEGRTEIRV